MKCDAYFEKISFMIDGELPATEVKKVMSHIEKCSRCDAKYEEYRNISNLVRGISDIAPPLYRRYVGKLALAMGLLILLVLGVGSYFFHSNFPLKSDTVSVYRVQWESKTYAVSFRGEGLRVMEFYLEESPYFSVSVYNDGKEEVRM